MLFTHRHAAHSLHLFCAILNHKVIAGKISGKRQRTTAALSIESPLLIEATLPFDFHRERFACHAPDRFYPALIGIEHHLVLFPRNVHPNAERI